VIKRLLIANRGEIAVRIMRACRELGMESVAVYSDADANALHRTLADAAVPIGPAPAADSYLSIPKIIRAAQDTHSDAIHPGYGFLSEQPGLAAACAAAGITFVGPSADAIRRMGSKIEARRLMASAGVPIVPGETPADQSDAGIRAAIDRVGYPALIKASAGGGGKGMRDVRSAEDTAAAITSARREALAAFGDGTLYVERLIDKPHHIEVQVFGDQHGNVVHLIERECSAQRRHQKVIEECPSPNVSATLRERMTGAAVNAARAAGYTNAGTIEFLVDASGAGAADTPFYFLEMNTRLQVEHPVTEHTLGIDLVAAQLIVASGEPLPWRQDTLSPRGHSIEARLYAEDPSAGFLPQAGPLLLYREPSIPGVRIDSGVREGDRISVHYDPLIAKVIATADTRERATARLQAALRAFPVLGVRTNLELLLGILDHEAFRNGTLDTTFLDRQLDAVLPRRTEELPLVVRAAVDQHRAGATGRSPGAALDPWNGGPT